MEQLQQKPQKSQTWIWTTLWLTTFIDGFLLLAGLSMLIVLFAPILIMLPFFLLTGVSILVNVVALWLASRVAVNYVLKRSIVPKSDATKLAILTITVPVVVTIVFVMLGDKNLETTNALVKFFIGGLLSLGVVFYSVRQLISTRGD